MLVCRRQAFVSAMIIICAAALPGHRGYAADEPLISVAGQKIEFGAVIHGRRASKTARVYNNGNAPLQIDNIRSNCPCFRAEFPQEKTPAGGFTVITVIFTTIGIQGEKLGALYIHSNSAADPILSVPVSGDVRVIPAELQVLPATTVNFGKIETAPASKTLTIENLSDRELELTMNAASSPVGVQLRKTRIPPGEAGDIILTFSPSAETAGAMRGTAIINTNFPLNSAISISWNAEVSRQEKQEKNP